MRPARAVGDMICRERIAKLIEFAKFFRFLKSCRHEWQCGMTELMQTGFEERNQFRAIADFPMLPCGFQSQRMGEATGWKC